MTAQFEGGWEYIDAHFRVDGQNYQQEPLPDEELADASIEFC